MKTLSLETVVSRRATDLQVPASSFFQHVLTHYLLGAWPLHILVFAERLERLLLEEYRYTRESAVWQEWTHAMVHGNFWCVARYRENPVVQLQAFFETYRETFHDLEPAERAEDRHGGIIVNERFILPRDLREITQEKAVLPSPWESLPSLISRVASNMGYRRSEAVLKSTSDIGKYRLVPKEIPLWSEPLVPDQTRS